ncbi:mitochondrial sodium hydrogen exchanger 9b2 [Stylonychia lemnae]|uniref:Mitochondrial sodium hydrogen exchanger 9b2 n=1 Tax=Stylonychia lemnae TaxID=5949 RepID=A0A077ZUS2_STYLE|nr:mitochondrial sodium hydrogen exchanger 9b2 [Stylonychia lemnae]|eukprot:CDW72201.1 mitochondrial sodium hydrogen exchanger 9b2 [Stylonychia lemnae]
MLTPLLIIIGISIIAGAINGLIFGFTFPKVLCINQYRFKPFITIIQIPSLIMMILFGCVARNYLGEFMHAYPTHWSQYIRSISLSLLLIRGGLSVTFQGKGLLVLFLSFVPQQLEAMTIAALAYKLLELPLIMCFCLAYILSCISPSVMVPGLMNLLEKGYGKEKGVISTLIAAGTFDNIICILCFGICKTIAYSHHSMTTGKSLSQYIVFLFFENLIGFIAGFCLAMVGIVFNKMEHKPLTVNLKMWYCIFCAIFFVVVGEETGFANSKFIASLTFGYCSYRVWGEEKPHKEIGIAWWFIQPIFFGSVGASFNFSQIQKSDVGLGIIIIVSGVLIRLIVVTILSAFPSGKYTTKERAFIAISWMPKATVQAALSSVIFNDSKALRNIEMMEFGNRIQTVGILSIVVCAPIGAILISTLGPRFLSHTPEGQQTLDREKEPLNEIEMEGDFREHLNNQK